MEHRTGPPTVKVHAVEVHDDNGNHLRTHLQPGGRYWPDGAGVVTIISHYRTHAATPGRFLLSISTPFAWAGLALTGIGGGAKVVSAMGESELRKGAVSR